MKCSHCGICCGVDERIMINLTIGDIFRLSQFLKIPVDKFLKQNAGAKDFYDPQKKEKYKDLGLNIPCQFRINKRCSVYDARPVNCRIFPYWILASVPEKNLKEVLKLNKCKYDMKNKEKYQKYSQAIAEILLKESDLFELAPDSEELPVEDIKKAIVLNLGKIAENANKLENAEKILNF